MTLSAFNAQAAVRDDALRRLESHAAAGRLQPGALLWDGEKGSIAGVLAETDDPIQWEARLGLARWMAYALDAVTGRLDAARALTETQGLLQAIPLGHDTAPTGSVLIVQLLEEVVSARAPTGAMADALEGTRKLHHRCIAGQSVSAAEWKIARRAAIAACDALAPPPAKGQRVAPDEARRRVVGEAIEAAGWDPRLSPTAVSEVLGQWLRLEGLNADRDFGWTAEDGERVRQRLAEMHSNYIADKPAETRTVFDFLAIDHRELSDRLRAYLLHGQDHGATCCARACDLLRRLLHSTHGTPQSTHAALEV